MGRSLHGGPSERYVQPTRAHEDPRRGVAVFEKGTSILAKPQMSKSLQLG